MTQIKFKTLAIAALMVAASPLALAAGPHGDGKPQLTFVGANKDDKKMQHVLDNIGTRVIGAATSPGCKNAASVVCLGSDDPGTNPETQGPGPQATTATAMAFARVCVQDSAFCQDANLKRVIDRNSVIDSVQTYADN